MLQQSYSQGGQDVLLHYYLIKYRIIPKDPSYIGSYVDVGCNMPIDYSNTYHFYERGWSGVCIDANPLIIEEFKQRRPRDQAIACGVGIEESQLEFYVFRNHQHSTFLKQKAERAAEKLKRVDLVPVRPLKDILESCNLKSPDFMSIDVEGLELDVLKSLHLDEIRPKLIVLEAKVSISAIFDYKLTKFMEAARYELIGHTGHDAFYRALD